jgi:hypothetical protein
MFLCMRTTLDIEDAILERARRRADRDRTTLTSVVERALRQFLSRRPESSAPLHQRWVVVKGDRLPDVDIADRDRLIDAMGDRQP